MLRRNMTPDPHQDASTVPPALIDPVADQYSAPAQVFRCKVYRSPDAHCWIVEPPRDLVSAVDKAVFAGPRAQHLALTYAYERFGNARFFPY